MITIPITEEIKDRSLRYAKSIESTGLYSTPNYTGLNEENRFYYGYVGELCFDVYLKSVGADYKFEVRADGKPGGGDFILYRKGGFITLDVKTASKSFYTKIMLPKEQMKKYKYDVYVGLRLLNGDCEIWGYCYPDEFEEVMVKVPTMEKDLSSLRDVTELL